MFHYSEKVTSNNNYHTLCICPSGLASVNLHKDTVVIGSRAFDTCSKLTNVVINDKVTRIESNAFYDCGKLSFIRIPGSVTFIGNRAFSMCFNLNTVYYCGPQNSVTFEGTPFPTKPSILVSYDGTGECSFCDQSCQTVLDAQCNIPTMLFTICEMNVLSYHGQFHRVNVFVYPFLAMSFEVF